MQVKISSLCVVRFGADLSKVPTRAAIVVRRPSGEEDNYEFPLNAETDFDVGEAVLIKLPVNFPGEWATFDLRLALA